VAQNHFQANKKIYGKNIPEKKPRGRTTMPIFYILWAIPAIIVIGGGAYWLAQVH
jgi:hypothetical protein